MGAAWGSSESTNFGRSNNCELCPSRGSSQFDDLCMESGFGPEGKDIDECRTLPNLCENGQCINTLGSYRCICDRGFKPDIKSGNTKCNDVDECLQRPGPCEHMCTNTWGSYTCTCPTGYGKVNCQWLPVSTMTCVCFQVCFERRRQDLSWSGRVCKW